MEIEGQIIITQPLNLTGLVVVSGAGGGGGGTTNYNDLTNKPAINGTTLSGNKTSHQLGVADEVHTHTVAQITDFPTLAPVATSGSYSDLTGTPTIPTSTSDLNNDSGFITINDVPAQQQSDWNEANTTSPAYIQHKPTIPAAQVNADWNAVSGVEEILNKPALAAVATSGNYNDLSNTPSIPAAQVNSDWDAVSGVEQILNKPTLATVATTGNYNDLSNKPTIPSVSGKADKVSGAVSGDLAGLDANGNLTDSGSKASDFANASHTHGNITNDGKIQASVDIANGDRFVITDASSSQKLMRTTITFDGSTTTKALSQKGTWETFYQKPSNGIPSTDLDSAVQTSLGLADTAIQDISGKADKVSGAIADDIATLDSSGNPTDSGITKSNVQSAITNSHSHTNKAVLDMVPASLGTAGQALCVNGNADGLEFKTISGGGGLSDYNFTHTADATVSGSVTMTAAADQRCTRMVNTSSDLAVTFAINNGADNYLWIKNTGGSDIDITISAVTYNGNAVANVYIPTDGITVAAGMVCEIGIICNADGAFITSRSDLSL